MDNNKSRHTKYYCDHSFSAAALPYSLAINMGLNAEKCALIALYHEINEVLTEDIATRYDESLQVMSNKLKKIVERKNELELI